MRGSACDARSVCFQGRVRARRPRPGTAMVACSITARYRWALRAEGRHERQFLRGFRARAKHPAGDAALYTALYGSRFAVQSSAAFAAAIGYPQAPIDDLLVFHIVFGKSVPDISLNAVANLGYAGCRFLAPVYPGDTLSAQSEVIGLRENSNRKTGVVFVRSTGLRQDGTRVLEYVRWVMVRKRDEAAAAPGDHVPKLADQVEPAALGAACPPIDPDAYEFELAG